MNNLSNELREELIKKGASLVGFADLSNIASEKREGFKYGVSIAVALNPTVISKIGSGPTREYYSEYIRVNSLLDELDNYAAKIIESYGYNAIPKVVKSVYQDETSLNTVLPHKTVATRSGLGWIGKCALLVTEGFGSAIRLSTILTDAELDTCLPINESKCGNCSSCKNSCPGNAVIGINWNVDMDRDEYFNAFNCSKEARKRSSKIGIEERICGKCIVTCPWTKKYLKSRKAL